MEFRILGRLEVLVDREPARLGGPKQRAVLATLILNANRSVSADVLIDTVWGESPPPAARSSLQSYLSHLRQAIGPDRIDGSGAYRLVIGESELDADRFRAAVEIARRSPDPAARANAYRTALALWRGPVFDDLRDVPALTTTIVRLEEERLGVIEERIEAELETGDHALVLGELEALTVEHPTRERLWGSLMVALYRSGRQADALGAFERARSMLADELGIDPSDALQQIHELILKQDPTLTPADAPRVTPALTPTLVRNPFKGLRPFQEADADDFFGREASVARLLTRLAEPVPDGRLLIVLGSSGSGKSSLVRAGIIPALRAGAIPGSDRWFIAAMQPGVNPAAEAALAIGRTATGDQANVARVLPAGSDGLVRAAEQILPPGAELVLLVDQLEELFTLVQEEHDRAAFLDLVAAAVTDPRSRVRVIATLRADFYDRPLLYRSVASLVRARTEVVLPMTHEELEAAIDGPAARAGVTVAPSLIAALIADVGERPGALPLLQYAMTELFERRRGDQIGPDAYRQIGGASGALTRRAEETYANLSDGSRSAARQVFLRLITLGEGVEDTRRRALRSDLRSAHPDPTEVHAALEAFGNARLLSFDRDPETRQPTVELAHEALIGRWARLRSWIDEARDDLRIERSLDAGAREWIAADNDPSFLLTGTRLDQLEAWRAGTTLTLGHEQAAFLDASLQRRDDERARQEMQRSREQELERRGLRRLRISVAALTAAVLFTSGLTVFAVGQRERAQRQQRIALARGLASASLASLDVDDDRSILLALAAVEQTRGDGLVMPEAEDALHRAVSESRSLLRVPGLGGAVDWTGDLFVTEGPEESGLIDIRDARTGASVRSFIGHDIDVNSVAFSADGTMLATGGDDGTAKVWDPRTGERLATFTAPVEGPVTGTSFSVDGRFVSTTWFDDGKVRVYEVATGRRISTSGPIEGLWLVSAFSPDGRLLALPTQDGAVLLDPATGRRVRILRVGPVTDVDWSPDGRRFSTGGRDGRVRLFDPTSWREELTIFAHDAEVSSVDWSPDGAALVTGASDGTSAVWDLTRNGARLRLELPAVELGGGASVAFGPDGNRVLRGDQNIESARIWDVRRDRPAEWSKVRATPYVKADFPAHGGSIGFDATGHLLASEADGRVRVLDPRTGKLVRTLTGSNGKYELAVAALAVARDGTVATAHDATVQITPPGERTGSDLSFNDHVVDVAWNADGSLLAILTEQATLSIVDRSGRTRKRIQVGPASIGTDLDFAPSGSVVAVGTTPADRPDPTGSSIALIDWERGTILRRMKPGTAAFAFSPDGTRIAITPFFSAPQIWAVDGTEPIATLTGHAGPVTDITYSPDGARIATAGSDGIIGLWDAADGTRIASLRGHRGPTWGVAFSRDGSMLGSIGEDRTARVWAMDIDDLIALARERLTRSLTDDECRQYLARATCPS